MKLRLDYWVKPYVRQTQRSKYVDESAQEYNGNRDALRYKIREELIAMGLPAPLYPKSARLRMHVVVARKKDQTRTDASNLLKAVEDAGNEVLYDDDCQIWELWMTKVQDTSDWVEIALEEIA